MFIVCLLFPSIPKIFTRMEMSPLRVKGPKFLTYTGWTRQLNREYSSACNTYCDTGCPSKWSSARTVIFTLFTVNVNGWHLWVNKFRFDWLYDPTLRKPAKGKNSIINQTITLMQIFHNNLLSYIRHWNCKLNYFLVLKCSWSQYSINGLSIFIFWLDCNLKWYSINHVMENRMPYPEDKISK